MIEGAVAFVTGASRGIGREVARELARRGARTVLVARTSAAIEAAARDLTGAGSEAMPLRCDVTREDDVLAAVRGATERFGPIDVLVNCAGIADGERLDRITTATWEQVLAVNLTGTFLCTRAVLASMVERRSGRIINIASLAGRVGFRNSAAYCAAKHGVLGFTRAVAIEVATSGVTVNAICPGFVDTEMTAALVERLSAKTGHSSADMRRVLEATSPQNRFVQPQEVAALAAFLAGPDASAITGQAYNIDGGQVTA